MAKSFVTHLECARCGQQLGADRLQTVCPADGGSLLVRYDVKRLQAEVSRSMVEHGSSMWAYAPLLPADDPVSLGEGQTPLLHAVSLSSQLRIEHLFVKDEGLNPTGTFKARGLSCAVSMLRQFRIKKAAIPTAGNAGSALAAYAARAGIEAYIFAPADVPASNLAEYRAYGAQVQLVDGLISDCAREVQAGTATHGWFDVSTLREPYRVEGKKTMGFELAEQFGWSLPNVIVYPAGGGVGLIGMWKAFQELEELGWIAEEHPRMVAVQAAGCAPIVRAFERGESKCQIWENAHTIAAGLRVPKPYADELILRILRESGGRAIAVSDDEIRSAMRQLAVSEGIFAAPEGAACVAAARHLAASGWLRAADRVVLFNTGSALKYLDVLG
jgi:threonine synthase